jgi:hypothetical protein
MPLLEEQLKNKEFFAEIKDYSVVIINEDRFREAYDLAKALEQGLDRIKDFERKYYDLCADYQKIIYQLKWIGLPVAVPDKVADLLQHHFTLIFQIPDFDLWSKLKIVIINIIIFEERDKFKAQLRQALLNNKEKLTTKNLIIDKKGVLPTVGNWLIDYNKNLGTGIADKLARTQYWINSNNIKNLSEGEKNKAKLLFDIYEKLKLSSNTLEGLEEDVPLDEDGLIGTISGGAFQPFKETERQKMIWEFLKQAESAPVKASSDQKNKLDELRIMLNKYPPNSLERKAIEEEIEKLEGRSKK